MKLDQITTFQIVKKKKKLFDFVFFSGLLTQHFDIYMYVLFSLSRTQFEINIQAAFLFFH